MRMPMNGHTVRLPDELWDDWKAWAALREVEPAELLRQVMEVALRNARTRDGLPKEDKP